MVSGRASWVQKLAAGLFGSACFPTTQMILPISRGGKVLAVLAWSQSQGQCPRRELPRLIPAIRQRFLVVHELEKSRREVESLRWLLARADRPAAVAAPLGEVVATSLPGSDFLKGLRFGEHHFYRSDRPELPPCLLQSLAKLGAGQVRIGTSCTARFEALGRSPDSWLPLLGIEFFEERPATSGLPLSRLSTVERDIYAHIARGATNREIAEARGTAFSTTKNQVSQILMKMGVARRINLVAAPTEPQFLSAKLAPDAKDKISVTR